MFENQGRWLLTVPRAEALDYPQAIYTDLIALALIQHSASCLSIDQFFASANVVTRNEAYFLIKRE